MPFSTPTFIGRSYVLEDASMTTSWLTPGATYSDVPIIKTTKPKNSFERRLRTAIDIMRNGGSFHLGFYAYQTIGSTIGHTANFARVTFG